MYRARYGLIGHPFPQDAQGKSFSPVPSYKKLERRFRMLIDQPGLGLLTADSGAGKTCAIRNLCASLPRPDHLVVYICDTATGPVDVYRSMALEMGVAPSHRKSALWHAIKERLIHLVDEQGVRPILVLDEAQHLSDRFLDDLSGFLNFAMDSRNLITVWLVGQPAVASTLRYQRHASLGTRLVGHLHIEPLTATEDFSAFFDHGLKAAGATTTLFTDSAKDLLHRSSRGVPRRIGYLAREALMIAHERDRSFVDDAILEAVLDGEEAR
jgi:type II secretory pathway predicted ATPase ExeA